MLFGMEFHQLYNVSTYVVQRFIFIFSKIWGKKIGTFFQENIKLVEIMYWEKKRKKICLGFSPQKILSVAKKCY
jgi:hypothetical protein